MTSVSYPTLAHSPVGDPTAIPIGSPTRVDFLGEALPSNRSFTFPLSSAPLDLAGNAEAARAWLAAQKNAHPSRWSDPRTARAIESAERLFSVQTPEELRRLLGPARVHIKESRSVRPIAPGVAEHTASYGLHGRNLLRVMTRTRPANAQVLLDCASDPVMLEDPSCGMESYDPYFDPAPLLADAAAIQAEVDALNAEIAYLEYAAAGYAAAPGECDAERIAYYAALGAVLVTSAEWIYYIIRRNPLKIYTYFKLTATAHGAFWTAFTKYRDCLRGTRPRYPV